MTYQAWLKRVRQVAREINTERTYQYLQAEDSQSATGICASSDGGEYWFEKMQGYGRDEEIVDSYATNCLVDGLRFVAGEGWPLGNLWPIPQA